MVLDKMHARARYALSLSLLIPYSEADKVLDHSTAVLELFSLVSQQKDDLEMGDCVWERWSVIVLSLTELPNFSLNVSWFLPMRSRLMSVKSAVSWVTTGSACVSLIILSLCTLSDTD